MSSSSSHHHRSRVGGGTEIELARGGAATATLPALVPAGGLVPAAGLAAAGRTGGGDDAPEGDGVFRILWRRKWLVLLALALCLGGAYTYLRKATPLYTSVAKIYVEKNSPVIIGNDVTMGAQRPDTYLFTHHQLMICTEVVGAAVRKLEAEAEAEGLPPIEQMVTFKGVNDPVKFLQAALLVEVEKKESMLVVSLDSPDPAEAARIVNHVIDAYRADQRDVKEGAAAEMLRVLEDDKADREDLLVRTQTDLWTFKKANPGLIFTTDKGNIEIQTLAKLRDKVTDAQVDVMYLKAELAITNSKRTAQANLAAAEGKLKELFAAYKAQEKVAAGLNEKETEVARLTGEIEQHEKLIVALDTRIAQVKVNSSASETLNIRVIEPAVAPEKPSKPQALRVWAAAVVVGLMLGLGLAWVRESTVTVQDQPLTSAEEIGTVLGMPVLGMIPSMPGRQTAVSRGQKVHLDSMSDVAEAFRTLRTVVYFSVPTEQAKTLLVTSPQESEGKSTVTSGLAIAMAKAGRRVLLVDADLRKPTLHRVFEASRDVGLSSVMAGKADLEQAIQRTAVEGLDLLPCGPIPNNPSEILNSQAFGDLLEKLAGSYDHVLVDSPPVLAVTDARILAAVCDLSILVLRAGRSPRRVAEHACNALLNVGARMLGIVVNDVARKKSAYYGGSYGYGSYGYGKRAFEKSSNGSNGNGHANGNGHSNGHVSGNGHSKGHGVPRLPEPTVTDVE